MFDEPDTYWLMVTNLLLFLLVLVCVVGVVVGVAIELLSRARRRHSRLEEIDHDMETLFGLPGHQGRQPPGHTHRLHWGHR